MREYLSAERARQGAQQRGLTQSRDAFQQHVPAGEQADQDAFHYVVLADDDFGDFPADGVQPVNSILESRFGSHIFHCRAADGLPQDRYRENSENRWNAATQAS